VKYEIKLASARHYVDNNKLAVDLIAAGITPGQVRCSGGS